MPSEGHHSQGAARDCTYALMHTHMQTLAAHCKAVCLSRSACSVQVPLIEAQPSEVDLGDCYLYYPYSSCVELINRSGLFARYSLQGQVGTGRGGVGLLVVRTRHCARETPCNVCS